MADKPGWRVRDVHVHGLRHTRESVVLQELAPLRTCGTTLREIGMACKKVAESLQALGAFDGAEVLIDTPSASGGETIADVVVTVNEKKRLSSASAGVSTSAGESSLDGNFSLHNTFGHAERIDLNMELGEQKSTLLRLAATRPRFMGMDAQLVADLSKSSTSHLKHSSFIEKLLGGSVGLQVGTADSPEGMHEFGYQLRGRNVCKVDPACASWSVLQQRGHSQKSAVTYTYKQQDLDHPLAPTRGTSLQLSTEVAGVLPIPLGDVRFIKQSLSAAAIFPVLGASSRLALSLSLDAGLLVPFGSTPRGRESSICDRFFLGGPGSLWGFRTRGCGLREYRHTSALTGPAAPAAAEGRATPRDSLGGDVMCASTVRLSCALPGKLEQLGMRAHAFASLGGLASLASSAAAASGGLGAPMFRLCGGVGVAMPTALGRLEVNLTHAARRRPEDAVVRNGLQVGLSPGLG